MKGGESRLQQEFDRKWRMWNAKNNRWEMENLEYKDNLMEAW
jgi:hypothetical protein